MDEKEQKQEERWDKLRKGRQETISYIMEVLSARRYSVEDALSVLHATEANIMRAAKVPDPLKMDRDTIVPF